MILPNLWLVLIAFVLGLIFAWFTMTRTVTLTGQAEEVGRDRTTDRETVRHSPSAGEPVVRADPDVERDPNIDVDPDHGRGPTR